MDLLKETADEGVISDNGPFNWQSRLYDLTPLVYLLKGYIISLVHGGDKQEILERVKNNRFIVEIHQI